VPKWSTDNKCFSCHNNGDGARALYTGLHLGFAVPARALAATADWLKRSGQWDQIDAAAGSSDKSLARIQFAAALVEAVDAQARPPGGRAWKLGRAAELVAEHQKKDGSWQVDVGGNIGSPATYGPALATYLARRTLQKADAKRYQEIIAKADGWLEQLPVKNVLDAAAVLLALKNSSTSKAASQRRHCLDLIRKGEAKEGGWGPYVNSPPEAFDTAVVLLALAHTDQPGCKDMLQRGRTFLTASQQEEGSWKETTRPAGAKSYAQRISTTAWATMALLETSQKAK
jgi:hypothetical protein